MFTLSLSSITALANEIAPAIPAPGDQQAPPGTSAPTSTPPTSTKKPSLFQQYSGPEGSKLERVEALPRGTQEQLFAGIINTALGTVISLSLISFTVGGIMFVTARGKDEQISKAKVILAWSILALVIIASSYAIILGISQLQFFQ